MRFLLILITTTAVINEITCSQALKRCNWEQICTNIRKTTSTTTAPTTTTPTPSSCSFSINDLQNVTEAFIQNKNTANAIVQSILKIQQDVMSSVKCTAMCAGYCSDYSDYPQYYYYYEDYPEYGNYPEYGYNPEYEYYPEYPGSENPPPTSSPPNDTVSPEEACMECLDSCPQVPIDPDAVAQFDRYYDGNLRAIQVMQLDVQYIDLLTRPASPDSQYVCCELKNRALTAMKTCGSAIINCTDVSTTALIQALQNMKLPECTNPADQASRTNYVINSIYFSTEGNLRMCKAQYIDAYYAKMALIYADLDTCAAQTSCTV